MSDNLTEGPMESEGFVEIPLRQAQAFGALLTAVRTWRAGLVPKTSTGVWEPTRNLLAAIATFDHPPCDHPRSWRVYRVVASDADEVCGYCGTTTSAGLRELQDPEPVSPGPVVSDPTSSSPAELPSPAP
jgi:hypothetical protein